MRNVLIKICVIVLLSGLGLGCASGFAKDDVLDEMSCYKVSGGSDKDLCEVPSLSLFSYPSRFDNVNVRVTGYLRMVGDSLVLYPSKDMYIYSAGRGGVELLGEPAGGRNLLRGEKECTRAVTVIGRFTSKISGGSRGTVGAITGKIAIFTEEFYGEPPSLNEECVN